jgi:N-acetylmuramoyl-L-alanine amidase
MRKIIVIDPGHGGKDPGAVYSGVQEKSVVLQVCLDLYGLLSGYSDLLIPHLTRSADVYVSLSDRADFANRLRADVFISVHCNAEPESMRASGEEAHGEEIWISDKNPGSVVLSDCLRAKVDLIFPNESFRGVKKSSSLAVLNMASMPACLIELGFIDKSSSMETFTSLETLSKIAGLLMQGIESYFMVERR